MLSMYIDDERNNKREVKRNAKEEQKATISRCGKESAKGKQKRVRAIIIMIVTRVDMYRADIIRTASALLLCEIRYTP